MDCIHEAGLSITKPTLLAMNKQEKGIIYMCHCKILPEQSFREYPGMASTCQLSQDLVCLP